MCWVTPGTSRHQEAYRYKSRQGDRQCTGRIADSIFNFAAIPGNPDSWASTDPRLVIPGRGGTSTVPTESGSWVRRRRSAQGGGGSICFRRGGGPKGSHPLMSDERSAGELELRQSVPDLAGAEGRITAGNGLGQTDGRVAGGLRHAGLMRGVVLGAVTL